MKKINYLLFIAISILLMASALFLWYFWPKWVNQESFPYHGHMIGGWGMPFGMLGMGVFWMVLIYLIFNGSLSRQEDKHRDAVYTLKKRLAKGEITLDEYETLMEKIVEDK